MKAMTEGARSDIATSLSGVATGSLARAPGRHGLLLRRPGLVLAIAFLSFVLAAAAAPNLLTSYDPYLTAPADRLAPPSAVHWFGADELGRDLFARIVHGSALSVQASLIAVGIAFWGGLALGVVSGFVGGRTDAAIMRFIDVLLALPSLLLSLAIITAIGFGTIPVAIAVGIGITPGFARTTRSEVLRVKTLPYVEAARLGGASRMRTLLRHILPNSCGPVIALATLEFGVAIIAVAGLSFLGFGAEPPAAEWGTLIANGRNFLVTAPWLSLIPGLFVMAVVLAANHVARTLEERRR
jgi:peptide/nickel transport system permease protein